ncbi:MAG: YHS domain-containing protein [Chlorobi bacterium]|nr:YHS domain-containing protein [Chlorobiota bacterium]
MEHCIVCGMEVKVSNEAESMNYENKIFYFCTTLCKVLFEQEPKKYIDAGKETKSEEE